MDYVTSLERAMMVELDNRSGKSNSMIFDANDCINKIVNAMIPTDTKSIANITGWMPWVLDDIGIGNGNDSLKNIIRERIKGHFIESLSKYWEVESKAGRTFPKERAKLAAGKVLTALDFAIDRLWQDGNTPEWAMANHLWADALIKYAQSCDYDFEVMLSHLPVIVDNRSHWSERFTDFLECKEEHSEEEWFSQYKTKLAEFTEFGVIR